MAVTIANDSVRENREIETFFYFFFVAHLILVFEKRHEKGGAAGRKRVHMLQAYLSSSLSSADRVARPHHSCPSVVAIVNGDKDERQNRNVKMEGDDTGGGVLEGHTTLRGCSALQLLPHVDLAAAKWRGRIARARQNGVCLLTPMIITGQGNSILSPIHWIWNERRSRDFYARYVDNAVGY